MCSNNLLIVFDYNVDSIMTAFSPIHIFSSPYDGLFKPIKNIIKKDNSNVTCAPLLKGLQSAF